jgi:hypothetical protein
MSIALMFSFVVAKEAGAPARLGDTVRNCMRDVCRQSRTLGHSMNSSAATEAARPGVRRPMNALAPRADSSRNADTGHGLD